MMWLLRLFVVYGVFSLCYRGTICTLQRRPIRHVANGYEGMTIVMARDLPESEDYIERIKTIFTQASVLLYKASKQKAYFKNITIVVPSNWKGKEEYGKIYGPQFDTANVVVKDSNNGFQSPFVLGNNECGKGSPYAYMRFYPYSILNQPLRYLVLNSLTDDEIERGENKTGAKISLFTVVGQDLKIYVGSGTTKEEQTGIDILTGHIYTKKYREIPENSIESKRNVDKIIHTTNTQIQGKGRITNLLYISAKTVVRLWGQLRWGLFDEFPESENAALNDIPAYYMTEDGTLLPNVCTSEVKGIFRKRECSSTTPECAISSEQPIESGCTFCPDSNQMPRASIMGYSHLIDSIVEFCDSDGSDVTTLHNKRADTPQNRVCSYKSSWEIMRGHPDFQNVTAGPDSLDATPTFNIVQQAEEIVILVLDMSGSMQTRLQSLRAACEMYIMNVVKNVTWIGIVTFKNTAALVQDLVQITSTEDRERVVQNLPSEANGGTSIGAGLEKALETIQKMPAFGYGSTFSLVTDGEENVAPCVNSVLPKLEEYGITVSALALSKESDKKMVPMLFEMGGKSYFYSENVNSTILSDIFIENGMRSSDPGNRLVQIESMSFSMPKVEAITGSFYIDNSTGKDTAMYVMGSEVQCTLTSPSGKNYKNGNSRLISLPGLAEIGVYRYNISSAVGANVSVGVISRQRTPDSPTIEVESWLSSAKMSFGPDSAIKIYSRVFMDDSPVLHASVKAVVENENGEIFETRLGDKGIGADMVKDDGIYTKYIVNQQLQSYFGRHNVKVLVNNDHLQAVFLTYHNESRETTVNHLSRFQRTSLAGEFMFDPPIPGNKSEELVILDNQPPCRINDLQMYQTDTESATLTWTAVGDNFDEGNATYYDVRLSHDFDTLLTSPDMAVRVEQNIPTPNSPGQPEKVTVSLANFTTTDSPAVYIGIRAVDESSNFGNMSNIIMYRMPTSRPTSVRPPSSSSQHTQSSQVLYVIVLSMVSLFILH